MNFGACYPLEAKKGRIIVFWFRKHPKPADKIFHHDQVNEDEIGRAWEKRNVCKILVGKSERKSPLGRPRRR
jgi:hypothetical protein